MIRRHAILLSLLFTAFAISASASPSSRQALFEGDFVLKRDLRGVHPRLYASSADLEEASRRFKDDPAWCAIYLPSNEMTFVPQPFVAGEGTQKSAMILAKLAVAWRITGDDKYRDRMRLWLPVLKNYQPPKFTSVGGPQGLTGGHVLLGLAIAYDVIHGRGDSELQAVFRDTLIRQGKQIYAGLISMQDYPYEQNHLIIPVSGLGVAAMVLVDEEPECANWGIFAGNLLNRTFEAIAYDGWFFEGFNYWNYTMQFPAAFGAAQARTVGGNAFKANCFRYAPLYLAHMTTPNSRFVFDFADWGPRTEKDGVNFQKGYNQPWHTLPTRVKQVVPSLMLRANDGASPFLRDYLAQVTPADADMTGSFAIDAIFGMLLQLPAPQKPTRMAAEYPGFAPYHHFRDMDVMHWRTNWSDPEATALAVKSGPPAGHHFGELLKKYPEWRPALGHAHPDAGSFILFAKGVFLANDTGYLGAKESADHNTILVDGEGQFKGGTAWRTFTAKPYEEYNKIHLAGVWLAPRVAASTAVFKDAYSDTLGLSKMDRRLLLLDGRYLIALDQIEAESPHEYEWRLHTDSEAHATGNGRFVMTNHPAQLVIQSLNPVSSATTAPTVVETSVSAEFKMPQQRGFHVALISPKQKNFEFLTAFQIQSDGENPAAFRATKGPGRRVDLTDGKRSSSIWIAQDEALTGSYAYLTRDEKGVIVAAGLYGTSLKTNEVQVELDQSAAVSLVRSAEGVWSIEASNGAASNVVIEIPGVEKVSIKM